MLPEAATCSHILMMPLFFLYFTSQIQRVADGDISGFFIVKPSSMQSIAMDVLCRCFIGGLSGFAFAIILHNEVHFYGLTQFHHRLIGVLLLRDSRRQVSCRELRFSQ